MNQVGGEAPGHPNRMLPWQAGAQEGGVHSQTAPVTPFVPGE